MRARDKFVHRWKADRQVGHPVILAGPAKMIGRAFYSATASTGDFFMDFLSKHLRYSLLSGCYSMEYNKKCISSRFLKLTYPTFNLTGF